MLISTKNKTSSFLIFLILMWVDKKRSNFQYDIFLIIFCCFFSVHIFFVAVVAVCVSVFVYSLDLPSLSVKTRVRPQRPQ
jgi:hypothetical protein